MTDPKEALISRVRAFAKVLPKHDWTSALLAGYNPTGSLDVSFETAKALLASDIDALASLSASVGVTDFDTWWGADGRFYDPDTSDVPWFDKRRELAEYAFNAALSLPSSGGEVVGV